MLLKNWRVVVTSYLILMLMIVLAGSLKAQAPSYKIFASPDEAGDALLQAAKSGDQSQLLAIFGPEAKNIIFTGNSGEDKATLEEFIRAYGEMHRWRATPAGTQLLIIRADNFVFPIPLRKTADGKWFFDAGAGEAEILRRRVGRDELAVIDICYALADAEEEYRSQTHDGETTKQYAQKFLSDSGKQNGLYWEASQNQSPSPLGPLVAFATSDGYKVKPDAHAPYYGYFFKMLPRQGSHARGGAKEYIVNGKMTNGYAFIAYPAEYGNSGVMTFIINQNGVLFEKDLGMSTAQAAESISAFDPDDSWDVVTE